MAAGDRVRVLYLGGLGRSGSTLAERLLGELPGICAAGEIVHLWRRCVAEDERCGCGEWFSKCGFWSAVGETAFGGWDRVGTGQVEALHDAVDRTRHIPWLALPSAGPGSRPDLDEYTNYYLRAYRGIRAVSGSPVVVDSSKHASLAFCLRRSPEIDLRVIHVVRDSRAVTYSWTTRVARPDTAPGSFMATYPPIRAAVHWVTQNGAFQVLARLGTPVLRIRYEDLVRSPRPVLSRMARFAGLDVTEADLEFLGEDADQRWAELRPAHTASGNPIRFTTGRMAIRCDSRWRTALPDRQRRLVTALTLPLLAHYGYVGSAR